MGGLFVSTVVKENVARVENCEQLSAASHLSFSRKRLADALDRTVDDGFDQFLLTTDRRWIDVVGEHLGVKISQANVAAHDGCATFP